MLTVGVLGPVEVLRDGVALDLGGPQQRAVVAHLAIDAGRVVPVERLIDRVWGDQPSRTPLGTLQSYVSRLRRVLEPDRPAGTPPQVLVSEAPGYVLRVEPGAVDAHAFTARLGEARQAAAAGYASQALQHFDSALALWRGSALAGVGPDDQVRPIVVRLEEERALAVEERFDALLALGRHAEAVPALQAAVDATPLRERLWAQLALALYRSSRQADALRAVATARATLLDELGLDPGPELRELENRILAHDPALLAVPAAVAPVMAELAPLERPTAELVGRAAEWAALQRALERAGREGVQLGLLEGEPGIGKSTISEAFLAHARANGWRTAVGRCVESGLAPSLWPVIEIVRALIDGGTVPPAAATNALYRFATDDDPAPLTLSPVELADELVGLIDVLGATPIVLLLDDLHWADQATLDVTVLTAERLGARRVLVVGAHRPPEIVPGSRLGDALGRLARAATVHRVAMTPLTTSDVARLIEITTGSAPTDDVAGRVQARAGGNPLFVAELARLAGERGITDADQVPAAIRDVVRSRLAQLPPDTTRELQVAATVGGRFDLRTVMAASERDPDSCLDAIDAAIATRIVVPDGDGYGYAFAHALVRDAVLSDVTPLRQARLHDRVADALVAAYGEGPDQAEPIAHHRLAALEVGDRVMAARAAVRGADVARWRGALDAGEQLAERALEALAGAPRNAEVENLEILALEALAGVAFRRLGSDTRGLRDAIGKRVLAFGDRVDHDGARALGLFLCWDNIDERDDLRTIDDGDIRELAERTTDRYAQVMTGYMIGAYDLLVGRVVAARERLEAVIAAVGSNPDVQPEHVPLVLVPVATSLAAALAGDAPAARIHAHRRTAAWLADRAAVDATAQAAVAFNSVLVEAMLDDPAAVHALLDGVTVTDANGFVLHQAAASLLLRAWAEVRLGNLAAVADAGRHMAMVAGSDEWVLQPMLRTFHGAALLAAGEPEAIDVLAVARAEAEARHEVFWLAETIRLQAFADRAFAGGSRAERLLAEARALATEQGAELVLARLASQH